MINFRSVSLRRGARLLFQNASLTIPAGARVGVTGANGSGKSSLFQLLLGELGAEAGELTMPPGLTIAHVAQETPASDRSALDYVLDGDRELRLIQARLEQAHGAELAHWQARLEAVDGYRAPARAARLLRGLSFAPGAERRPVAELSGGWRMRLNIAQALMCRSDLLLLDEPTNHLDLDAVIWLQDWLADYPGTLLLVSHDRDFLDRLVDHVLHIENQAVTFSPGNYSAFERRRAEALVQQQAARRQQQRQIARIRAFVDRFRAQATKARQVQSRLKTLERMELIAQAQADSPFEFCFPAPAQLPSPLVCLEGAAAGYGGVPVLTGLSLQVRPGDRVGLLGPNGAGKSTLVKLLAGELPPSAGVRSPAQGLRIGYFAQHQLEQLRPEESALRHGQRFAPQATERDLRSFLGGFGFRGERALEPIGPFSGGEKSRLALALLVLTQPQLLLLDEPTNHLDLPARDALSLALQDYPGAVVVVSHDRHLLRAVADQFWLVADGRVEAFPGDLEDYRDWLNRRRAGEASAPPRTVESRKDRRRAEADRRRQLRPLQLALQRAEAALEQLSGERQRLDLRLADPALYRPEAKAEREALARERAALEQALAEAEAAWWAASEAIERTSSEAP